MTKRRLSFRLGRRFLASGRRFATTVRHPAQAWRRWSTARRIATVVGCVVGLWLLVLVVDVYRIQSELRAGRSSLTHITADEVDAAGGVGPLADRADRHLQEARRLAHSSFALLPLSVFPGLDTQVRGVRDITDVTATLGRTAKHEADGLQSELKKGASAGRRIMLIDRLLAAAGRVEAKVSTIHVGAKGTLLPPLSGARTQLVHELAKVQRKLGDSSKSLTSMRQFLAADHNVLVLGSNNAEMRGGNGMPLSAGVAHIHDGQIEVGTFTQTADLWNPNGPVGDLPVDLLKAYGPNTGGFAIGQEWRETNVSPNFPEAAPIYVRMAARQGLGQVDGVILVDALALRALFQATGPITVDNVRYDADNVVQQVLNENYKRFGDRGQEARGNRIDLQSKLAKAAFEEFNTRSVSATKLAAALLAVTPGRHVLAWSNDPGIQATWERLGISGGIEPDAMLVSFENISANKLDFYLSPFVGLDIEPDTEGNWLVTMAVALYNYPRNDTSPAIEGGTYYVKPRDHRVYLDVHLPGDAYAAVNLPPTQAGEAWRDKFERSDLPFPKNDMLQPGFTLSGLDPPSKVLGTRFTVPYGTSRTLVIQFHLPGTDDHVTVLPSGRLNAQVWQFRGQLQKDERSFVLRW